jgi:HPt (histidine-containing phosphotransfer) domain-containing protein
VGGPIDLEVIETLRQLDKPGERSFLQEMIEIFFEDSPPRIEAMRSALDRGDAEGLTDAAHAMKGSCSNFGAHELEALCRQLESVARVGELTGASQQIDAIEREYARVRRALSSYLSP